MGYGAGTAKPAFHIVLGTPPTQELVCIERIIKCGSPIKLIWLASPRSFGPQTLQYDFFKNCNLRLTLLLLQAVVE